MTTKVKGLLKGLRYISQIFDTKEHEMQIGYPTDVKHVAHIGWDSPSVNSPSWMNEFRSAQLSPLGDVMADPSSLPARIPSDDRIRSVGLIQDSPSRESQDPPVPKPRRHASSGGATAVDSPTASPGAARRPRRKKSATGSSGDSAEGDGTPTEFPGRDPPVIPKVARKKKAKAGGTAAGGEGSSRSAKSRDRASLPDGSGGDEGSAEHLPVEPPFPETAERT